MDSRIIQLIIDSFWDILLPGLTMTIPLTAISFSIALVIATATALVQYANIRVLKEIARLYIWVVRGTPLIVQLFVIFYGLPSVGIVLPPFPAAVIVFVKDTSLAANITVAEMFMATQRIVARTYEPLVLYMEVGFIYLMFCTVLTWLQRKGEMKLSNGGTT